MAPGITNRLDGRSSFKLKFLEGLDLLFTVEANLISSSIDCETGGVQLASEDDDLSSDGDQTHWLNHTTVIGLIKKKLVLFINRG